MISDLVLARNLPEAVAVSLAAYAGCIAGAVRKDDYFRLMGNAGFRDVQSVQEVQYRFPIDESDPYVRSITGNFNIPVETLREAAGAIMSVCLSGIKPA